MTPSIAQRLVMSDPSEGAGHVMQNSLIESDREHLIHPVVSWSQHEQRGVTVLESGKGVFLRDMEGNTLLDGFAGLWCVNVGYGHDSIVKAAAEQMTRLPYATGYFHYGSEPAILLAKQLAELAPGDLNHVFFTLGGSDAVDSAMRFIRYYFNILGKPTKKHVIALDKGYHGSTSTGAGITGLPAFHKNFDVPLGIQHHIPAPYPYRAPDADPAAIIAASVAALTAKVAELGGADNVAAFFCEVVQGSGGVIVPPTGWFAAMRKACTDLGILFVADEVITGFGRTGPMFACEHENVVPDIMTVAKGLTSGYSPMGAVLLSSKIFRAIADNTAPGDIVGHGFTYSGHPVSAAVGLEVMRLYLEGGILANGQKMGLLFGQGLAELADHPLVGDVRAKGLLAGIELVACKKTKAKFSADVGISPLLATTAYKNKLIFRAFADGTVGFAPPLCITSDEVELLLQRFRQTLDDVLAVKEVRNALD
jgi:putrescine aminotransferase